ncbi:MAG: zinc ABC transporter solute-binding protein [Gammaproteobacteria bacterium]|nr:zinc ABC transporter solute-binding protein [Gammaproteobacteria bacterium]
MAGGTVAGKLSVFVSILPQKYFVEQVGGDHVMVSVMVNPGHGPATYEPTPRQLVKLGEARLYFKIGMPFERSWLRQIESTHSHLGIIDTRRGINMRSMDRHHHGGSMRRVAYEKDPHSWTNPKLVIIQAANIRDGLITVDPLHRSDYESNYRRFTQRLEDLDQQIRQHLKGLSNRKFLVFHPSWGYYADRYGLRQLIIEVEGKEPGARQLAEIIAVAKREGIKIVFIQSQFSRHIAQAVAKAIGATVVALDPLAENYIENLTHVTKLLAEALRSQ